jgi:ABC-type nitrate/sulfonate/bicarbonate transport system substrate-binding protein
MNKKMVLGIGVVLAIALVVVAVNFGAQSGFFTLTASKENNTIRVGWINTFVESAYVSEPLIRTQILADNGIEGKFTSFLTGPPMSEAAAAKNIDVMLMGWAPTSFLLEKDPSWEVVGKFAYFDDCLLAKTGSGIETVADFNGKKFGVPFGSGPYAVVYQQLARNNLVPNKDVELVNISPTDFAAALSANQVDGVGWGKATLVALESKGLAHEIVCVKDYAIITMSKDFIKNNPTTAKAFIDSIKESSLYFALNQEEVYSWVAEDAKMDLGVVKKISYSETNFDAKTLSDVDLSLSVEDILEIQSRVDFSKEQKILKNGFDFNSKVNMSLIK